MIKFLGTSFGLSYIFNLGSILGVLLLIQILTGLLLVLYYSPDRGLAFSSVQYLIKEVNNG